MSAFGPSTAHVNPLPWARTINEHVTRSVTVALSLSSWGAPHWKVKSLVLFGGQVR